MVPPPVALSAARSARRGYSVAFALELTANLEKTARQPWERRCKPTRRPAQPQANLPRSTASVVSVSYPSRFRCSQTPPDLYPIHSTLPQARRHSFPKPELRKAELRKPNSGNIEHLLFHRMPGPAIWCIQL